ncbi:UDP-N-acetylmuramate:L-alanyl-gamma-D-glutamyl-meso-diaminopimelate ligase [Inmirania thermothiophila]|uniref:UDP-N-acetylmuramate--L-alanyl-gamma-D-glutamyl-meso-2,6-diaminoheptandioate ligase n=1 Tax=Inmirania thermothiophila TaxID=1750597 RepID=A0A3N1Y7H6_9GAMM|nr:UDP-N-acetylmuramate:L-alanyl-gamma-D-glutamyl-meso-diaminopimelate ligase [Inmirania thermothiophila]ROR34774.1 UDP-N-acetylmuramate: L-alanyl-gamma-D-glutamyl-meso-diaminopimelate ligase [Inmirania thermothiophila]
MRVHILGICGTFMGGLAQLARALGHEVSGQDAGIYPPMSELLAEAGIEVREGWDPAAIPRGVDCVVVGNALSRGNPAVEHVLDRGLPYTSGPQWLAEAVLRGRWVIAVAGTHGKTTTTAMVAWILAQAGLAPGWLVGGAPRGLGASACLGETPFFVVEADEYDTAFFDKRAKFVHYRPRTLVLNNLEFDHADIYPDLAAIQRQVHHLVRTVPASGRIVAPAGDAAVAGALAMGCWTPVERTGPGGLWQAEPLAEDASAFRVRLDGRALGEVRWRLAGAHNLANALSALAAARHAGVAPAAALEALAGFPGVRRRLEVVGEAGGVTVYDDFAHHPTAIAATLAALRPRVGAGRLVACLEPRSNTMRMGVHREALAAALAGADRVHALRPPGLGWDLAAALAPLGPRAAVHEATRALVAAVAGEARPGDHVVCMSNGAFDGVPRRLLAALAAGAAGA